MIRRVLFVSFASYFDDANGASVASRAMLEALVRRGFAVEVLCGPILELNRQMDLASSLAGRGLSVDLCGSDTGFVGARPATPYHFRVDFNGVPITILAGSVLPRAPDDEECRAFLRLFEQVWAGFQPEVVVSYGGGWLTREVMRSAKARGAATVFRSTTSATTIPPRSSMSTPCSSPLTSPPSTIGGPLGYGARSCPISSIASVFVLSSGNRRVLCS